MSRTEQTITWIKNVFNELVKLQEEGALIIDGNGLVLDRLFVKEWGVFEDKGMVCGGFGMHMTFHALYGEKRTKKYWRNHLKAWRFVLPADLKRWGLK